MSKRRKKKQKKRRSVAEATARRREKAQQGFSDMFDLPEGTKVFNVGSAGTLRLDVIPYEVGEGNPQADKGQFYWERTFHCHRGIGVNDSWVICPARTIKEKCPICEFASKMQNDPDADEDTIKALAPSRRMLINVVDLKKDKDTVQVWHVSHAYFGKAMDEALQASYEDHADNMDNFCDPEDGYFLKCVAETGWQGKGYSIERVDFKSRKEDLDDDILNQAVCLDDVLVIKEYDELKEMLMGGEDDDDDDDDDDKPKSKKKRKKKKSKKKKEADDDDDDFSDDNDDNDDDGNDNDDWSDDDDDGDDGDGGLEDMDEDELLEYIKENSLIIKGKKKMDEDELREAIEEAEQDDDGDDDDDEPESKKKKKKKKKKKRK